MFAQALHSRRFWLGFVPLPLLVVLYATNLRYTGEANGRRVGFDIGETAAGLEVRQLMANLPAERAGLEIGDRLLAIDGHPIANEPDYDRVAASFSLGHRAQFEIERGGRRETRVVETGVPFRLESEILNATTCFAFFALAVAALYERRRGDLRALLLYCYATAVALELALPTGLGGTSGIGLFANVSFYLLSGFQMGADLHLATLIPDRPAWAVRQRWIVPTYYVVGAAMGLAPTLALLAQASGAGWVPWTLDAAESLLFDWGLPLWATGVSALLGFRFLRLPPSQGRDQAGLVLLGLLPWVTTIWMISARSMMGLPAIEVSNATWALVNLVYPIAVFVAIFRYGLIDLELVVRRSLLYGVLTVLFVALAYGLLAGLGWTFAHWVDGGGTSVWLISALTLALGLLFQPLRRRLENWIDRRFYPNRYAFRRRVVSLAAELPAHGKLPRMGEHLVAELSSIFDVDPVTVWIAAPPSGHLMTLASTIEWTGDLDRTVFLAPDDPGLQLLARSRRPLVARQPAAQSPGLAQRLAEAAADLVVPLVSQEQLVGVLVLGKKRGGERVSAEEMELLTLLAHHVATVFENARLFESATYEGLTGLYRREAVLEILERETVRAVRYGRPLTVALADLDHFKEINDRHGHLGGDLVLQRIAAALRAQLRATDSIGRYGGEEFMMVLPETDLEGAFAFAEKVRQLVESLIIPMQDGTATGVTISIGLASRAEIANDEGDRSRALISAADDALYAAKRLGRNRVEAASAQRVFA